MDEAFIEHRFDVDGFRYYCIEYPGDPSAPPVILIHGLLMDPRFWFHQQVERIRGAGSVYSISLAGHYPAQFPDGFDGPITEELMVRMIEDQLQALKLNDKPVVLIGHSTGALAALAYTIHKPERVLGLGVLSTTPHGRETGGMYKLFQVLNRDWGALGFWLWAGIIKSNSISMAVHRFLQSDVAHDKRKMLSFPGFRDWIAWYFPHNTHLNARNMGIWLRDLYDIDLSDRLHRIEAPVLLMYAENDPYMSPETLELLKSQLTGSTELTAHLLPATGHLYMYESHETFEPALKAWIEKFRESDPVAAIYDSPAYG